MATRGIIRGRVRHNLGESTEGTWTDDTLNYFTEECCDEHAQRALSVKVIRFASSIKDVQDYEFYYDFGELCSIRYFDENGGDRELAYVNKSVLRDLGYRGTELGRPIAYYREQDKFGLFPIPEKRIIFEHKFEGRCEDFTSIIVQKPSGAQEAFSNEFNLQIVEDDEEVVNGDLDPECVYVSQIGVYLRRKGRYYPGRIKMTMLKHPHNENYLHESIEIPAESINTRPEWVVFDFTHNPIEINPDSQDWTMYIQGTPEFYEADPREYGGEGILIGVDTTQGQKNAYLQMHRLRNDIEVEYYRNKCDPLVRDDQLLEIPQRYHHTIVKMNTSKSYAKGNYNMPAANYWRELAEQEIEYARTQAIIPTLGKRLEIRDSNPLLPNLQYLGDGNFRIRFGTILG